MGKARDWYQKHGKRPVKGMSPEEFHKWTAKQPTRNLFLLLIGPFLIPASLLLLLHSIPLMIVGIIIAFLTVFMGYPAIIHLRWKRTVTFRQWQESRMKKITKNDLIELERKRRRRDK
jgi:hypothetical protein